MKCYQLVSNSASDAIKLGENEYLVPHECTEAEENAVFVASLSFEFVRENTWCCQAENDGGIDSTEVRVERSALDASGVVLKDGVAVGYYILDRFFSFAEEKKQQKDDWSEEEFVPCWGSISERDVYWIERTENASHFSLDGSNQVISDGGVTVVDGVLISLEHSGSTVNVPSGVRVLGKELFRDAKELVTVTLPEGLTSIEEGAFMGCIALKEIFLPETLLSIGNHAFQGCVSLEKINLPSALSHIGSYAFHNCKALRAAHIPNGIKEIKEYTFGGCVALSELTLPPCLEAIENRAFFCSAVTALQLPASLRSLGEYAFANANSLESLAFSGDGGVTLGEGALAGCKALRSVIFSGGVYNLGDKFFSGCSSLEEICLPASLISLGAGAFSGCESLKEIALPYGITRIGNQTFMDCTSLRSVRLPNTLGRIGEVAFKGCSSLEEIHIPPSVTTIEKSAFAFCKSLVCVELPEGFASISWYLFKGCERLKTLKLPKSVANYGYESFDGTMIESLEVRTGKFDAFITRGMKGLRRLTIGKAAVITGPIGPIPTLEEVHILGTKARYLPDRFFKGCTALHTVTLPICLTCVSREMFMSCASLKSLSLPPFVKEIEWYAFDGCTSLESISIPGDIRSIWADLALCPALKTVYYPNGREALLSKLRLNPELPEGVEVIPLPESEPIPYDEISILFLLESHDGYVRLNMRDGTVLYGEPRRIEYLALNGKTEERIGFKLYKSDGDPFMGHRSLQESDIESFTPIAEEDIPL